MKLWLSIVLLMAMRCQAALIEVSGTTIAAINTALASASAGDVVRFPFTGTFDFGTSEILIDKRIFFVGWTRSGTIFSRAASSPNRILRMRNIPDGTNICGVANLTFAGAPDADNGMLGVGGTTGAARTNRNWRIHHVTFSPIRRRGLQVTGTQQGVVDNCQFIVTTGDGNTQQGITVGVPNYQEQLIGTDAPFQYTLGTITNFVYVEDNGWHFGQSGDGCTDMYGSSRAAYRFNRFTNSLFFGTHDSTGNRSATVWECYGNTWLLQSTMVPQRPAGVRSGWGIIASNILTCQVANNPSNILLSLYRASGTNVFPNMYTNYPQQVINGTNVWDGNINTNLNEFGYPGLDQPGYGDPTFWTATNSIQTLHGIYEWSNTFNGFNMAFDFHDFCPNADPLTCNDGLTGAEGTTLAVTRELIREGRDCFSDTPKPGWVPFTYPHPYRTIASLSPAASTVDSGAGVTFTASGGSGSYLIYEFLHNNSGGSVNPSTGVYTAGPTNGVTDTVRTLDTHGNYAEATVFVSPGDIDVLGQYRTRKAPINNSRRR